MTDTASFPKLDAATSSDPRAAALAALDRYLPSVDDDATVLPFPGATRPVVQESPVAASARPDVRNDAHPYAPRPSRHGEARKARSNQTGWVDAITTTPDGAKALDVVPGDALWLTFGWKIRLDTEEGGKKHQQRTYRGRWGKTKTTLKLVVAELDARVVDLKTVETDGVTERFLYLEITRHGPAPDGTCLWPCWTYRHRISETELLRRAKEVVDDLDWRITPIRRHASVGPAVRTVEAGRAHMLAQLVAALGPDDPTGRLAGFIHPALRDGEPRWEGIGYDEAEDVLSGLQRTSEWMIRRADGRLPNPVHEASTAV